MAPPSCEGALATLSRRRSRKTKAVDRSAKRIAELERELARTPEELRKALLILEVQGKVAGLLGMNLENGKAS